MRWLVIMGAMLCASAAFGLEGTPGEVHRVDILGSGPVTVIFEAGLGDTLDVWRKVQPRVAATCARTLAYNRAGYPGSRSGLAPRTASEIVGELRAELAARRIEPPYVLVGHSLGGLYMQYFARNFPGEVAGLLLVDSTHWEQLAKMRLAAPANYYMVRSMSKLMVGPMRREFADSELAGEQVATSPLPRGIPTIVLSSSKAAPGETPAFRVFMRRLQDEMAETYLATRHSFPLGSGHYIQREKPGDVVNAIEELAGCRGR
jgi:pimeloyl-ACP methyl ester carboxylesterase